MKKTLSTFMAILLLAGLLIINSFALAEGTVCNVTFSAFDLETGLPLHMLGEDNKTELTVQYEADTVLTEENLPIINLQLENGNYRFAWTSSYNNIIGRTIQGDTNFKLYFVKEEKCIVTFTTTLDGNDSPLDIFNFNDKTGLSRVDIVVDKEYILTDSDIPTAGQFPLGSMYKSLGWDKEPLNYVINEDTAFKLNYVSQHEVFFFDLVAHESHRQIVTHEEDAVPPTYEIPDGYSFYGWSLPYTNITNRTEIHAVYYGDCNTDYVINTGDATSILKVIAGMETQDDLQKTLSDVNTDGSLNTGDAVAILKLCAEN